MRVRAEQYDSIYIIQTLKNDMSLQTIVWSL